MPFAAFLRNLALVTLLALIVVSVMPAGQHRTAVVPRESGNASRDAPPSMELVLREERSGIDDRPPLLALGSVVITGSGKGTLHGEVSLAVPDGVDPVVLRGLRASCGCLSGSLRQTPSLPAQIAPGSDLIIDVSATARDAGAFTHSLTLIFDDRAPVQIGVSFEAFSDGVLRLSKLSSSLEGDVTRLGVMLVFIGPARSTDAPLTVVTSGDSSLRWERSGWILAPLGGGQDGDRWVARLDLLIPHGWRGRLIDVAIGEASAGNLEAFEWHVQDITADTESRPANVG